MDTKKISDQVHELQEVYARLCDQLTIAIDAGNETKKLEIMCKLDSTKQSIHRLYDIMAGITINARN
jgi:hypothetical protein